MAGNPGEKQTFRLLLVEDNPADARLVRLWIEEAELAPFEIVHNESLAEALGTLESGDHFEAILLDLTLPDSRGFVTLERLLEAHPDSNIIVLTGLNDKALGIKAVKAGAQDFLVKGQFESDLLSKTLLYAIERQHNVELRQARDVAVKSERMKERFLANISHEMRTPLNAVLGMSRLLAKTSLDEEQEDYLKAIQHSSEILLGIINDILEMSALREGRLHFDRKPFSVREQLHQVCDVMEYRSRDKGLEFHSDIEPELPRQLLGDPLRFNQILYNLIGNAIKFTEQGRVEVKAGVCDSSRRSCKVFVEVSDSGEGIPEDQLDFIFRPFTRIEKSRFMQPGTGLGLSIARFLVEKQGGAISVESKEGVGSVFRFELPFGQTEDGSISDVPVEDNGNQLSGKRILVVEDHQINRLLVKRLMEKQWQEVNILEAENGRDALDLLDENEVDLVLMDLFMPVMDGYEATKAIRGRFGTGLPIIALTAHATGKDRSTLVEQGFDDYILKPFHPDHLFKKITYYLSK